MSGKEINASICLFNCLFSLSHNSNSHFFMVKTTDYSERETTDYSDNEEDWQVVIKHLFNVTISQILDVHQHTVYKNLVPIWQKGEKHI